jgi:hypothetical protein
MVVLTQAVVVVEQVEHQLAQHQEVPEVVEQAPQLLETLLPMQVTEEILLVGQTQVVEVEVMQPVETLAEKPVDRV